MAKNTTLSLRVQWLGERLRKAREQAGYTWEEAGEYLQVRHNTLSRFETGTVRARPSYVRDLVDFYGISSERERAVLLQLNEDAWRKDWWDGDSTGFEMDFIDYTWLESRAARICVFEPMIIHGLIQTRDYACAITSEGLGPDTPQETIDSLVEVRMLRQRILHADSPTEFSIVLEEAPLHRTIGSKKISKRQLEALLDLNGHNNIDIRVLPKHGGWHPGLDGPFTFIDMPDPYPDVVYIETLVGRNFLEEEDKVERYRDAYDRLHSIALSPRESNRLIRTAVKDLK